MVGRFGSLLDIQRWHGKSAGPPLSLFSLCEFDDREIIRRGGWNPFVESTVVGNGIGGVQQWVKVLQLKHCLALGVQGGGRRIVVVAIEQGLLMPLRCKGCGGGWLEHGGPGLVVKDFLKEIGGGRRWPRWWGEECGGSAIGQKADDGEKEGHFEFFG